MGTSSSVWLDLGKAGPPRNNRYVAAECYSRARLFSNALSASIHPTRARMLWFRGQRRPHEGKKDTLASSMLSIKREADGTELSLNLPVITHRDRSIAI